MAEEQGDPEVSDEEDEEARRTRAAGPAHSPQRRRALRGAALVAGGAVAGALTGSVAGRHGRDSGSDVAAPRPVPDDEASRRYVAPGESIQDAIDAGAMAISLGAGTYEVTAPIELRSGVTIGGIGSRTMVRVAPDAPSVISAVFSVGAGGPIDGVTIASLFITCTDRATSGIDVHIVGTDGNLFGEPDAICRFDDLRIWQPIEQGIWYHGSDTQATVTSRVRVRRAGRYGFRIESPDNVWVACEATTVPEPTPGPVPAGFYVGSANGHFDHCKAWYVRGYGWHIDGVRNVFTGCEAQDCADHGFFIDSGQNALSGCMADTCSAAVAEAAPGSADGFFVRPESADVVLSGCIAFDRTSEAQQRHGFNVPAAMIDEGRFAANAAWNNRSADINRR